jgi:hypothetical protein
LIQVLFIAHQYCPSLQGKLQVETPLLEFCTKGAEQSLTQDSLTVDQYLPELQGRLQVGILLIKSFCKG